LTARAEQPKRNQEETLKRDGSTMTNSGEKRQAHTTMFDSRKTSRSSEITWNVNQPRTGRVKAKVGLAAEQHGGGCWNQYQPIIQGI
jgi:hypothetical protein